jgi:GR25 family glycosyltransferase involved in LPS biosynthesis
MDAYIISLNNPEKLINQVSDFGLNPILVNGVYGNKLNNKEINKNTTFLCSIFCPKSVIGIAMAHINVWEQILKSNEKMALVLEDDVIFTKNFKKDLDLDLAHVPSDFDIFYLGCFGCTNKINFYTVMGTTVNLINLNAKNTNQYINKPSIAGATHAYILSRAGAKKLLHNVKHKISYHLDVMLQTLIRDNVINAYGLNKRIVYQTSTDNTMSTNISTYHPSLINDVISNYYLDTKVKASYLTTVNLIRIGNTNFTFFSVVFLLLGIVLGTTDLDIYLITCIFITISIKDLYLDPINSMILIHYLLLIIPFLLIKYYTIKTEKIT